MKNSLKIFLVLFLFGNIQAQTTNFTVTNNSGTYGLTCLQTSIALSASTSITPPYSFQWSGPSFSVTALGVTITQAGTYTVHLIDSSNVVLGTHFFSINSNTLPPSALVSPNIQTITCNSPNGASLSFMTANNISHTFTSPYGGSVIGDGSNISYAPLGPGTYTHYTKDYSNGCQSSSTFTLVTNNGFPSFNLASPQNYTLGCYTQSLAIISLVNGNTQPPGGPVTYTLVPSAGLSQLPSGLLSSSNSYTVTSPGIYYAVVKDNTNQCMTQIPISIISNTTIPNLGISIPKQILDCNNPQVTLQGYSFSSNINYLWTYSGAPGTTMGSTVAVSINSITPSSTLINVYTLTVTDYINSCKSTTIIPMYQNTFRPTASIAASSNSLTCISPSVVLTNQSSTGIPQNSMFISNQPVIGFLWEAPAPQLPASVITTYTGYIAGVYTLTAKDLNNGCTSKTQIIIYDDCFNSVGLQKNTNSDLSIKLYPNPSKGLFSLSLDNVNTFTRVEIYNALGALIKNQAIIASETKLDLSSEANGLYFVYVIQDKRVVHTKKIVKD